MTSKERRTTSTKSTTLAVSPEPKSATDLLKEHGRRVIDYKGCSMTRAEALGETLWALALDGNVPALKLVFDRLDGVPARQPQKKKEEDGFEKFLRVLEEAAALENKEVM